MSITGNQPGQLRRRSILNHGLLPVEQRQCWHPMPREDLDDLVQKAQNEKGYVVEVAGFAERPGSLRINQVVERSIGRMP